MSIIAGIYALDSSRELPAAMCDRLSQAVSRNPSDRTHTFRNQRAFFAKVEIGAWSEKGYLSESFGDIATMAGEALLPGGGRTVDLRVIADAAGSTTALLSTLRSSNGAFCLSHYDGREQALTLATDQLGIRPLYYAVTADYFVFASALRIIESLAAVPKKLNVRAVSEIAAFGYALGDRTPYCDVSVLRAGEVLRIHDRQVSRFNYANWEQIETSSAGEAELLDGLYVNFRSAVSRRLRGDKVTAAYLSGGLDSRCVVAALREEAAEVHTFNFARPNTQDQVLGRLYAEKAGTAHAEIPKLPGDDVPDYSQLMASAWLTKNAAAERPHLVWSGEGGSVDLGHVHIARTIVAHMRAGREAEAIDEFIAREQILLSSKLLQLSVSQGVAGIVRQGIEEELGRIRHADPARRFYLFLMLNDQRRKLAEHFENIDLHRLEVQLPFFDSSFVKTIVSIPIELCLEHHLYVKWLTLFPPAVTEVPWQAYPGHVACPLPVPRDLAYQWDGKYRSSERGSRRRAVVKRAAKLVRAKNFPGRILNRKNLALAGLIHTTGFRDYGYLIESAGTYYKYWARSNGEFDFN